MDQLEFYMELYHKENDRKPTIQNALNIPIAILTAISTGTYYFITTFDYGVEQFLNYIFIIISSAAIVCIVLAIYHLIRAFRDFSKGYEYTGLPYTKELFEWKKQLNEHFEKHGKGQKDADEHFKRYLLENLIEHLDHNMYVNDEKSRFIWQSKKWLVFGLVLTLINAIPFGYNFFNKQENASNIIILNEPEQQNLTQLNSKKIDSLFNLLNGKLHSYEQQETDSSTATTSKGD